MDALLKNCPLSCQIQSDFMGVLEFKCLNVISLSRTLLFMHDRQ